MALRESASAHVASSINWESIQGVYTEFWGETKEQLDRRSEILLAHFQHSFSRQALRKGISFLFVCAGPLQKGSMASAAMRNREQGGHCSLQELRVGLAHLLEGDVGMCCALG